MIAGCNYKWVPYGVASCSRPATHWVNRWFPTSDIITHECEEHANNPWGAEHLWFVAKLEGPAFL